MLKIKFLSRGGQGGKTGAEIFAAACCNDSNFSQSSPQFGVERRGAPIEAYVRIDDKFINERGAIDNPDIIVVFDATLINQNTFKDVKERGWILVNAPNPSLFSRHLPTLAFNLATVDANSIARQYDIKAKEQPIINIIILGALNALITKFSIEKLCEIIKEKLSIKQGVLEKNLTGASEAEKLTRIWTKEEIKIILENEKIHQQDDQKHHGPTQPDEKCNSCQICINFCPRGTIYINNDKKIVINYDYCNNCCVCAEVCPKNAITKSGGR